MHRLDPTGGSPHANNARWLEEEALVRVLMPGEVPGVLVLGHPALKSILNDPDVSKDPAHFAELQAGRVPAGWPLSGFATARSMMTADGAEHRRLRSALGRTFLRQNVEPLRTGIEALVDRLLDRMGEAADAAPDGVVDLREHFALPLPLDVICELLGVPEAHRGRLRELSSRLVATDTEPKRVLAANREMAAILAAIVEVRKAEPGEDLVSRMLTQSENPGLLSDEELTGTLFTLIIAGHETTTGLLMNAVRALCANGDQLEQVQHGDLSWAAVVEETLRWDGPVSYFPFRYPTKDLDIDGQRVAAGTPVLAGYSAAGRDPAVYGPDADRFDVARETTVEHLAFGYGPHYCPGAPLARLEAEVALQRLFGRFPAIGIAVAEEELRYSRSFVGNVVTRLPVRLG